jgi:ribosome-associated heat shock protein Hsp15
VNRQKTVKPSHPVASGDVLTIALRGGVQVLKVLEAGTRRGPATEARLLYEVLSAPSRPTSGEPED